MRVSTSTLLLAAALLLHACGHTHARTPSSKALEAVRSMCAQGGWNHGVRRRLCHDNRGLRRELALLFRLPANRSSYSSPLLGAQAAFATSTPDVHCMKSRVRYVHPEGAYYINVQITPRRDFTFLTDSGAVVTAAQLVHFALHYIQTYVPQVRFATDRRRRRSSSRALLRIRFLGAEHMGRFLGVYHPDHSAIYLVYLSEWRHFVAVAVHELLHALCLAHTHLRSLMNVQYVDTGRFEITEADLRAVNMRWARS